MDGYKFEPISKTQVWLARFYIILAAALYGTSFPIIKILDANLPVNINLVCIFFFASLVTLPLLLEAPAINWNSSKSACVRATELGMWDMLGFFGQILGTLRHRPIRYVIA
jgi:drug/metabolite transporter (DMT)-like permease